MANMGLYRRSRRRVASSNLAVLAEASGGARAGMSTARLRHGDGHVLASWRSRTARRRSVGGRDPCWPGLNTSAELGRGITGRLAVRAPAAGQLQEGRGRAARRSCIAEPRTGLSIAGMDSFQIESGRASRIVVSA